jgi:threonine efflux protein
MFLDAGLLTVFGLWTLVVMAPGPDTLAVASTAIRVSRRHGVMSAAGCSIGAAVWASSGILGLGIIFAEARWLFVAIKWLGALYLVYLGARLVVGSLKWRGDAPMTPPSEPVSAMSAFRLGLLTDLSNPKAAVFFTSLFAVAVPIDVGVTVKVMTVALVAAIAFVWYCLIAMFLSIQPIERAYARARHWIEGIAGALFIGFGVRLVAARD